MLRQAADLACRMSAAAFATQGAGTAVPGALFTALRALGAAQLRGLTTGTPSLSPRYQARGCRCSLCRRRRLLQAPVHHVPWFCGVAAAFFAWPDLPCNPLPQVTTRSMLDEPANPGAKVGATVVLVSGGVESAALLSCEGFCSCLPSCLFVNKLAVGAIHRSGIKSAALLSWGRAC